MATINISKEVFNRYIIANFKKVSSNTLHVNLYTIVRVCIMSAENYSYKHQRLRSGAVHYLAINIIPDVITHLFANRLIDKNLHDDLIAQYQRDKDNSLPDAVSEFMKIIGKIRNSDGESPNDYNQGSSCCRVL